MVPSRGEKKLVGLDLPKAEEVADLLLRRLAADAFNVDGARHDCGRLVGDNG